MQTARRCSIVLMIAGFSSPVGTQSVGAVLSSDLEAPRKVSNDPEDLHGLGDISRTTPATLFAAYTLDWVTARTSLSADIGGRGKGTLAEVDLQGRYHPIERLTLSAGPGVTWASSPYMRTFFGVSAAQSTQSSYIMFAEYEF